MPIYQYRSVSLCFSPRAILRSSLEDFFLFFSSPLLIFSFSTVLRFASVRETYAWQVGFRSSRGKRPSDCWGDIFRRCPRSSPFSGFSILEEKDSYDRRWTCSVGRVFRPLRVETIWESEKASVDRVTVSAGESDVLPRFIEKRRSFIDDYYRRSLRNTISRVGTPVANNSVSPLAVTLCRARLHFHVLPLYIL